MRFPMITGVAIVVTALALLMNGQSEITQKWFRQGELEVRFDAGKMVIQAGLRHFVLDSAKIPIPDNECGTKCESLNGTLREQCHGKCAYSDPDVVGFDPARERLILGIFTDVSQNKPEVLVEANLRTGACKHLTVLFSSGLTNGTLSPSGRYLAFAQWSHMGGCSTAQQRVLSIWARQTRLNRNASGSGSRSGDLLRRKMAQFQHRSQYPLRYAGDLPLFLRFRIQPTAPTIARRLSMK